MDSRSACPVRAGKHQGFAVNTDFLRIIAATPEDRCGLFLATANRLGTPIQNVETDFWVFRMLDLLFNGREQRRRGADGSGSSPWYKKSLAAGAACRPKSSTLLSKAMLRCRCCCRSGWLGHLPETASALWWCSRLPLNRMARWCPQWSANANATCMHQPRRRSFRPSNGCDYSRALLIRRCSKSAQRDCKW